MGIRATAPALFYVADQESRDSELKKKDWNRGGSRKGEKGEVPTDTEQYHLLN